MTERPGLGVGAWVFLTVLTLVVVAVFGTPIVKHHQCTADGGKWVGAKGNAHCERP